MRKWQYHHMTRRVRIRVQADKAMLPALHQPGGLLGLVHAHAVRNRVVHRRNQIAEDATMVTGPRLQTRGHSRSRRSIRRSHVSKPPWAPKLIHLSNSAALSIEASTGAQ